jgi:cellobiose-specific phosphotransferase system component IIC
MRSNQVGIDMTKNSFMLFTPSFIVGSVFLFLFHVSGFFQYDNEALLRGKIVFRNDLMVVVMYGLLISFIGLLLAAAIAKQQKNKILMASVFVCCGMLIDVLLRWVS